MLPWQGGEGEAGHEEGLNCLTGCLRPALPIRIQEWPNPAAQDLDAFMVAVILSEKGDLGVDKQLGLLVNQQGSPILARGVIGYG